MGGNAILNPEEGSSADQLFPTRRLMSGRVQDVRPPGWESMFSIERILVSESFPRIGKLDAGGGEGGSHEPCSLSRQT